MDKDRPQFRREEAQLDLDTRLQLMMEDATCLPGASASPYQIPSIQCGTPRTLCSTPRTLCSTPGPLCSTPSTLCSTPSILCSTPTTLCSTPSTLCSDNSINACPDP